MTELLGAGDAKMKKFALALVCTAIVCLGFVVSPGMAQRASVAAAAPGTASSDAPPPPAREEPDVIIGRFCLRCHNDAQLTGGLTFESFNVAKAGENAEVAERMIRKLRAGMMPPVTAQRPDADTYATIIAALETTVDAAAAAAPNPGTRTFQRLNQPEYDRAIRELLALNIDAGDWLPEDQKSANFDNIADSQTLSPLLLEAYFNAAAEISRMAVGNRNAVTIDQTYTNSEYTSQHPWNQLEDAPYGTRGGIVAVHTFPADAEYFLDLTFTSGDNSRLEDIDVSIDGERVALLAYDTDRGSGADGRGGGGLQTEPFFVRAGQHKVVAAFIRRSDGPYEDLIRPHDWSYAGGGSGGAGITTLPHLRDLVVRGPYNITSVSETASRRLIFTCRPTAPGEERPCARRIIERLAGEAYRRPLTAGEVDSLLQFYESGAANGSFEDGVRMALEAILSSPFFVFRLEREPDGVTPGTSYGLDDATLASRLSFFLWGAPPDEELQELVGQGKLSSGDELEHQARRMLSDPRAEALASRFAAQWLRLQDLYKVHPDPNFFPNFDGNLAAAMQQETESFFYSLVREDRSVLELYTADYTFLNERLARHYGIRNVGGTHFRRVQYPDDRRRGVLGHGSILVLTSMANRTSPVLRGKWVMEVLMGTPPPPPPPNVPTLDETAGAKDGKMLTTRERMELHRANPACNSCHRMIDPIGLALDNFDVTGMWRFRENGMPLDTRGTFYDDSPISTTSELVDVLMQRPVPLLRTFTENLLAYALGRRAEYFDQPTIRAIVTAAEADDYRMSSFIIGVVNSDAFRMKRAAAVATDAAAGSERQ